MKNLKEFKELIKKYESITIEEIEANSENANSITGFGSTSTCKLCLKVDRVCEICIYEIKTNDTCDDGVNEDTYNNIWEADDAEELLEAFKTRAKYMESILTK